MLVRIAGKDSNAVTVVWIGLLIRIVMLVGVVTYKEILK